jgi:hypothetical protein
VSAQRDYHEWDRKGPPRWAYWALIAAPSA